MSEMRIMVLGAGGAAADNYIKSLRLADPSIYTLGVDTHPLMLELSSATDVVCIDTTPADGTDHWDKLEELALVYGITMIHAQPDQEALFLSRWQDLFSALVDVPEQSVVEACQDKLECARLLGDLAPNSRPWITPNGTRDHWQDVSMYNGEAFGESMWMRARTGAGSLAAKKVDSFGDAMAWEKVWTGRVAPGDFMLAEVLPGEDRSYSGVWWRGEPVAAACRVRVEYADTRTPSGQCSSPRIAKLDSRPETFDVAEAAIRRVSEATGTTPHGVFYVDMREAQDGALKVTEINAGRFNTTQNFYAEAGLNLPWIHLLCHHGEWDTITDDSWSKMRLQRDDDVYWVRQPDMGHKLVTKTKQMEGVEEVVDAVTWMKDDDAA